MINKNIIIIPENVWDQLYSWYGGGPIFQRKVIMTNDKPSIELYPKIIKIF